VLKHEQYQISGWKFRREVLPTLPKYAFGGDSSRQWDLSPSTISNSISSSVTERIHATRTDERTLGRDEPYSWKPKHIAAVRPDSSRLQTSPAFQQRKYAYHDGPKARIVNVVGGFSHQDLVALFQLQ
jgi:hypothetical protein